MKEAPTSDISPISKQTNLDVRIFFSKTKSPQQLLSHALHSSAGLRYIKSIAFSYHNDDHHDMKMMTYGVVKALIGVEVGAKINSIPTLLMD